ncbi:hypothetical protein [Micromonospora sp. NPDC047738]|uniref:hypothetical protein n=1 Tax=unclassified Micromonospora TaxID=2617518 RepID=UPI0033D1F538
MSQPPSSPYPGSYPPPQQPGQQHGGGYPPQQQPQYGGGYPPAPQQPGPQYGGHPEAPQQPAPQYGGYVETGQPSFGGPEVPPKKKSKAGKIVLIVLAVVVVLCVGGGAAIYFAAKDTVGEVVDATKTRVSAPETLGGRAKVDNPQLQAAATEMEAEIKKDVPDATSTVGAFYGDPTKQDLVMIAGASGVMADPKKELEDATTGLGSELGVTEFKTVDAGPLGGDAKCGDGKIDGDPVGVCVWADRGSVGMIVMYFKPASALQSEFVAMRGEIEHKN